MICKWLKTFWRRIWKFLAKFKKFKDSNSWDSIINRPESSLELIDVVPFILIKETQRKCRVVSLAKYYSVIPITLASSSLELRPLHCYFVKAQICFPYKLTKILNLFGCLAEAIRKPEVLGFKSTKPTCFHYNVKYHVKEQIFVSAICNHMIWINQQPLQSSQSRIRIRICDCKP